MSAIERHGVTARYADAVIHNDVIHLVEVPSTGDADITVQTCWDADRLDLGRVGIRPDPRRLCTAAARNPRMIEAAFARSLAG